MTSPASLVASLDNSRLLELNLEIGGKLTLAFLSDPQRQSIDCPIIEVGIYQIDRARFRVRAEGDAPILLQSVSGFTEGQSRDIGFEARLTHGTVQVHGETVRLTVTKNARKVD